MWIAQLSLKEKYSFWGIKNCIKKHPVGCHSERSEESLEFADSNRFCLRNIFNDNNLCWLVV